MAILKHARHCTNFEDTTMTIDGAFIVSLTDRR